jgi:DNA-binding Lrp family transcriptional regulator
MFAIKLKESTTKQFISSTEFEKRLGSATFLVWSVLKDNERSDGFIRISINRLAKAVRTTPSGVRNRISRLRKLGLLVCSHRGLGRARLYGDFEANGYSLPSVLARRLSTLRLRGRPKYPSLGRISSQKKEGQTKAKSLKGQELSSVTVGSKKEIGDKLAQVLEFTGNFSKTANTPSVAGSARKIGDKRPFSNSGTNSTQVPETISAFSHGHDTCNLKDHSTTVKPDRVVFSLSSKERKQRHAVACPSKSSLPEQEQARGVENRTAQFEQVIYGMSIEHKHADSPTQVAYTETTSQSAPSTSTPAEPADRSRLGVQASPSQAPRAADPALGGFVGGGGRRFIGWQYNGVPDWPDLVYTRIPSPPLLKEEWLPDQKVEFLTATYASAIEARYSTPKKKASCWVFKGKRKPRNGDGTFMFLLDAAEELLRAEIPPAVWVGFSLDVWEHDQGDSGLHRRKKVKWPAPNWVFGVPRINKQRGWCKSDAGEKYVGGRSVVTPKCKELHIKHARMRAALMSKECSADEVSKIVNDIFPDNLYARLLEQAQLEVSDMQRLLRKRSSKGEWLWLP